MITKIPFHETTAKMKEIFKTLFLFSQIIFGECQNVNSGSDTFRLARIFKDGCFTKGYPGIYNVT